MERKVFSFEIKKLSDDGTFEGYAATFNNIDAGGDKILPGAFRKTLREKKRFPIHWYHDVRVPLGEIELKEDSHGLKSVGELLIDDIMKAKEIIKPVKVTPLPDVPDFIKGVINLRGMLLPVISMKERLGVAVENMEDLGTDARVILVALDRMVVGIFVDSVEEIIRVSLKDVQPPPQIAKGIGSQYLQGICRLDGEARVMLVMYKILSTSENIMMEGLSSKDGKKKK